MKGIKRLTITVSIVVCAGLRLFEPDAAFGFSYGDRPDTNENCLACHGDAAGIPRGAYIDREKFGRTTHAKIGCAACHGEMAKGHPGGGKVRQAKCRECHSDVDKEYAQGVHAKKTSCNGCHNPHLAEGPKDVSGEEINQMCSGCHDGLEMRAKHGQWLPQAELHLRMLPCITCHTGSDNYYISMYIVKSRDDSRFGKQVVAGYAELKRLAGKGEIVSLVDANADDYISLEELRIFNRARKSLRLHGMMTPGTVSHKFEILDNRRNCTFCHTCGPALMQTSSIAFPEKDGSFRRVPVEKGAVLGALYGTPDFYMMGSTKNQTLNGIGLAIICCGLVMPVGHGFVRFLTRKNRK